jgi:hypothetical protein
MAMVLVHLYPRPWRARYEQEMLATLEALDADHASLRTCLTLALCALDAHLDVYYVREELTMLQTRLRMTSVRGYLALLAGAFLALLVLAEYTFLRFPTILGSNGPGPKPTFVQWFGANSATIYSLGLVVFYALLYLGVAAQAPRSARSGAGTWRMGAPLWLVTGGIVLAASFVMLGLPLLFPQMSPLAQLGYGEMGELALLLPPVLCGALATRATGRLRDGVLAGFWSGLLVAVLLAVAILVLDDAFAATFLHTTAWAHDPTTCPYPAGGATLAGCEIGDNLGFVAIELAGFPLLAAGVGVIGSAIGRAIGRARSPRGPRAAATTALPADGVAEDGLAVWRAPLLFAGALLVLVVVAKTFLKLA